MRYLRFALLGLLALAALVLAGAPTLASPGSTERVSVPNLADQGTLGTQANTHSSGPSMSADGRYVVFHSDATNVVVGDTNATTDVFRHDRQTGTTIRVSVDSSGNQTTLGASQAAISADGRFVVFISLDGNLAPGPAGCYCLFIHDVISGITERVADGGAHNASVSADGRYVVFESASPQPQPSPPPGEDTNGTWDVYVKDRQGGTTLVSRATTGQSGNNLSGSGRISDDGLFVAFTSRATNLVQNDNNGLEDIFIRDMQAATTQLVSVDSAENQANNGSYFRAVISANGRYIAFESAATNLVPVDTNGLRDIFVRDVQAGTTQITSVDSGGTQVNNAVYSPSISDDGRFVAFEVVQGGFVPWGPCWSDIYVRDREAGLTVVASVTAGGQVAQCPIGGGLGSSLASITGDGSQVAFQSWAFNLVSGDTNGFVDVFVREMGDSDEDGVWDPFDNCPATPNLGQENNVHPATPAGDHCEDPDSDTVFDITDNCPDTANPGQENNVHSGTPVGDHCEDPDGDGYVDAVDNCPDTATPWYVPPGDCDGFSDADEGFVGTDPADNCANTSDPNDEADDRWPPDWDDTQTVNLMDLLPFKPHFNTTYPDPLYDIRYDLNTDDAINLMDLLPFKPFFNLSCTP